MPLMDGYIHLPRRFRPLSGHLTVESQIDIGSPDVRRTKDLPQAKALRTLLAATVWRFKSGHVTLRQGNLHYTGHTRNKTSAFLTE